MGYATLDLNYINSSVLHNSNENRVRELYNKCTKFKASTIYLKMS